ncbi:MAG TPA: PRC-barrel domain-containing protein [Azospirillum sp.]|nr:PRC-barrel domain-containing protein [Azospirillum sp.]
MRFPMFATASLAALLAAGAWAQDPATQAQPAQDGMGTPTTPPADPAPSASMGTEMDAEAMIGRTVFDKDDQEIGKIEDVAVDSQTGRINRLVIGSGDPAGTGRKIVAVDMEKVEVTPEKGIRLSGLTRNDVAAMPDFTDDSALSLGKPRGAPEQKP